MYHSLRWLHEGLPLMARNCKDMPIKRSILTLACRVTISRWVHQQHDELPMQSSMIT